MSIVSNFRRAFHEAWFNVDETDKRNCKLLSEATGLDWVPYGHYEFFFIKGKQYWTNLPSSEEAKIVQERLNEAVYGHKHGHFDTWQYIKFHHSDHGIYIIPEFLEKHPAQMNLNRESLRRAVDEARSKTYPDAMKKTLLEKLSPN